MLLRWLFDFWFLTRLAFFLFGSGKGTEAANASTGQAWGSQYNQLGTQDRGAVLPFLENELTNPAGLGAPAVAEMKTQEGEIAAGGTGQAKEAALLNASRTGNTAAVPGIIDAAARAGMASEATGARGVDVTNAKLKEEQRQAGAGGLEALYGQDVAASLKALGLSNEAANYQTQASTAGVGDVLGILKTAGQLGTAGADAYSTVENA